jgi:beta-carotene hydroxylase
MHSHDGLPSLEDLGRDLLVVASWRRVVSLALPFLLTAGFFILAQRGFWIAALACPVILSFITYGSTSHDLVHRTLALPRWLNESLLCLIELIGLRSGHAYRFTHLHHHAHFPDEDDVEARSARLSLIGSLFDGMSLQPRLFLLALRTSKRDRGWIIGEGIAVLVLLIVAIALIPWTPLPAIFSALMVAGSWIFPLVTVFIPHNAAGVTELTQTRLFRGVVLSIVAAEHLYHLEHHLYPQVPHHHWPALARRLDPSFARLGIQPLKLLF